MTDTFSIQKIINDKLANDNENREHKDIVSWHCSKIGTCRTGIYLERLGLPPDEPFDARTLRLFSAGSMFENWIVDVVKAEGITLETQVRVEDRKLGFSGYADAVVSHEGQKILYEVKSKHSKSFWYMEKQGQGASEHHKMQTWLYLYNLNLPEGRILYISRDDLAVLEYPVYLDDIGLKMKVMKELEILNLAWEKQLPPPVPSWDKAEQWKSKYCNYHKKCTSQPTYL